MKGRRRRIAVAGAAVAALGLAGGGATYAATSGGSQDEAGALAEALNANQGTSLTADDIQAALEDVLEERLDAAVAAGKLTQEQADQMLERAADRGFHLGPGGPGPGLGFGLHGGPFHAVAARALGLSEDALRTQLEDGTSLAEVATARSVPKAEVVAAIRDEILGNPPPGRDAPTGAQATRFAEHIVNAEPGERGRGGPPGPPPGP